MFRHATCVTTSRQHRWSYPHWPPSLYFYSTHSHGEILQHTHTHKRESCITNLTSEMHISTFEANLSSNALSIHMECHALLFPIMFTHKPVSFEKQRNMSTILRDKETTNPCCRLRTGTFNVHQFWDRHCHPTFDGIADLLRRADLDIIGLQESTKVLLPDLVRELWSSYKVVVKFGGTALLTRLPVDGTVKPIGKSRFSYCRVRLPGTHQDLEVLSSPSILVFHLDHRKETTRQKEFFRVQLDLSQQNLPLFDLCMGDIKALTARDYTATEWKQITKTRSQSQRELPASTVTRSMIQDGFTWAYTEANC